MAANILSPDFLGICLLLTKGDTNLCLDEVVLAVERFQANKSRHFGISSDDFRGMLTVLVYEDLGFDQDYAEISLQKIIPLILRHHDVHSNDTDTYWTANDNGNATEDYEAFEIERWNGYSKEEYSRKLEVKQAMKDYFSTHGNPNTGLFMEFLSMHGIDEDLLLHCSKPGESS